jgi:hypothetical protein
MKVLYAWCNGKERHRQVDQLPLYPRTSGVTMLQLVMVVSAVLMASVGWADSFTLQWNANTDAVAGYKVFQRGPLGVYDQPIAILGPVTSYAGTVPTPTADTQYFWVVKAYNAAGDSLQSTEVTKAFLAPVIIKDTLPPPTPMGVTVVWNSAGTCMLSWMGLSTPDLASYGVWASTTSGWYNGPFMTVTGTSVSCVQMGFAANGLTYYFKVSAQDTSGNQSAPSPEVSLLLTAPPTRTCLKWRGGRCRYWSQ